MTTTDTALKANTTIKLSDFLEQTREQLTSQASGLLSPRYTADQHTDVVKRLADLRGEGLNSVQADVAGATALSLTEGHSAMVVGEQRAGKTRIALATAFLIRAKRILITAPPHVVPVWAKVQIPKIWPDAHVFVLRTISDLDRLPTLPEPCIVVLSREDAKLGGIRIPGSIPRLEYRRFDKNHPIEPRQQWACPHCGSVLMKGPKGKPAPITKHTDTPSSCANCKQPLWTIKHPDIHGHPALRRTPLSKLLLRRYRRWFDLVVIDELHEYANVDTWQGISMSQLIQVAPKVLGLTATLTNGYASSVFPLLWRTHEGIRREYKKNSFTKWINQYGLWSRTVRIFPPKSTTGPGDKGRTKTTLKEAPGLSPGLIQLFLDRTAYVRMKDFGAVLPPYREDILTVEMSPEQKHTYAEFQQTMREGLRHAFSARDWKRLGLYTTALMTWPDRCWVQEPIKHHPKYLDHNIPLPPVLPQGQPYPKERLLLELLHRNRGEGRKVLVYATHTGTRDITARLHALASQEGFRSAILPTSTRVRAEHRIEWITAHAPNLDLLITHPKSVATGIPLNEFPTIVFMEPFYEPYTLRQAARRSWDLNQTKDVRVYFYSYLHTVQEQAWMLIGQKVKAALLLEGEFEQTEMGLATYRQEGDFLLELAKQIIAENKPEDDALRQLFRTCQQLEGVAPLPTCQTPLSSLDNPIRTPHEPVALEAPSVIERPPLIIPPQYHGQLSLFGFERIRAA